ncbi:MAG TPA: helical backbone metal receptor [Vicinamibacterales bacterium]|jgi:iron complex transport system substrate-binding protein|nr:helical backbone metal receptor [Vicinamibacterales bacterium]
MTRRRLIVLALAILPVAVPRASAPAPTEAPRRIISLVPAVTQMLFAIGGGARVIAVSNYDQDPAEVKALPRVGGLLDPDTERILALRPDLVIVYEAQHELEQRLTQAHIRYYEYAHKNLANVMATMRALGDILGTGDAAEHVARGIEGRLQATAARVAGRPRPSVLLVLSRDPQSLRNIYANGGYGFLHDMIAIAGGRDVFDDVLRENVQPSTELILARRPEIIIELRYGAAAVGADDLSPWQALPSLPAVKNHKIYQLVGDRFVDAGPEVAEATEQFARTIHPEAFK